MNKNMLDIDLTIELKNLESKFIRIYDYLTSYLNNPTDVCIMSLLIDYDSYHLHSASYKQHNGYFECTTSYIQNRFDFNRKKVEDSLKRLVKFGLIQIDNSNYKRKIKINKALVLEIRRAQIEPNLDDWGIAPFNS